MAEDEQTQRQADAWGQLLEFETRRAIANTGNDEEGRQIELLTRAKSNPVLARILLTAGAAAIFRNHDNAVAEGNRMAQEAIRRYERVHPLRTILRKIFGRTTK